MNTKEEIEMKTCPYCNQYNNEDNQFCVHCGKEISQTSLVQVNDEKDFTQQEIAYYSDTTDMIYRKKGKLKITISVVLVICLLIAIFITLKIGLLNNYSPEQKYAIQAVDELTSTLLRPDSFIPYDIYVDISDVPTDYYSMKEPDIDDEPLYTGVYARVYIHYSADNKGGGITESEVCAYINDTECQIFKALTDTEITALVNKTLEEENPTEFTAEILKVTLRYYW